MFEIGGRMYPMEGEDYISTTWHYYNNETGTEMSSSGIIAADFGNFSTNF